MHQLHRPANPSVLCSRKLTIHVPASGHINPVLHSGRMTSEDVRNLHHACTMSVREVWVLVAKIPCLKCASRAAEEGQEHYKLWPSVLSDG